MSVRKLLIPLIIAMSVQLLHAERHDTDSVALPKILHSFAADLRGGYVLSSHNNLKFNDEINDTEIMGPDSPVNIHSSGSIHLKYLFRYTPYTSFGRLYPGAYQGVGLSANTFFYHKAIGTPVALYLFQGAPIKHFSDRLSLAYEWNFGISAGWKKSNMNVPSNCNIMVGSKFNAYINLGFLLDYRVNDALTLRAGVEMTHFSDGNTALPNPGVNIAGARLGVIYNLGARMPETDRLFSCDSVKRHWSYDIMAWGSVCKHAVDYTEDERVAVQGHFATAGISFAPMYTVNQYFRTGPALDVRYDEGGNLQPYLVEGSLPGELKFRRQPFGDRIMAGISARAELVMPIFSVNVGIGYYAAAVSANRKCYQMANLKIHILKPIWLNIGYQLHSFKHPDNLMLGLGCTL